MNKYFKKFSNTDLSLKIFLIIVLEMMYQVGHGTYHELTIIHELSLVQTQLKDMLRIDLAGLGMVAKDILHFRRTAALTEASNTLAMVSRRRRGVAAVGICSTRFGYVPRFSVLHDQRTCSECTHLVNGTFKQ